MAERLTSEQRASIQAAIVRGVSLDEWKARYPDWPQEDLESFWRELETEIRSTRLKPGQYWGVPSEWH